MSIEDDEGLFPAYRRPTATLTINRNELASRLSDRINNKGQEQDEAWAAELDRSLRRGILQAAYKKLRHDAVNETEPYWTELAAAFTVYGALGGSPGGGAAALGIAHFTAIAMRMTAAYENRGSCRIPEFRPSIPRVMRNRTDVYWWPLCYLVEDWFTIEHRLHHLANHVSNLWYKSLVNR